MTTTTEVPATTAEVLEKALEVMRERGMCKKKLEDGDGRVCARGAIMAALGVANLLRHGWAILRENPGADRLFAEAAKNLHPELPGAYGEEGVDFNNLPDTTQAEVEAVFEEAIRMAHEVEE